MNLEPYTVPEQDKDLLEAGVVLNHERLLAARLSWGEKFRERKPLPEKCVGCSAPIPLAIRRADVVRCRLCQREYSKAWATGYGKKYRKQFKQAVAILKNSQKPWSPSAVSAALGMHLDELLEYVEKHSFPPWVSSKWPSEVKRVCYLRFGFEALDDGENWIWTLSEESTLIKAIRKESPHEKVDAPLDPDVDDGVRGLQR